MRNDAGVDRRRPAPEAFSLRGRNKRACLKCCAVRTLCYISRIDAKRLETANVQGIHKPMLMLRARHKALLLDARIMLPGICSFSTARSVAFVFMERIA